MVKWFSLDAFSVCLTFVTEGHERLFKFGISIRPLAHILDMNKGEEKKSVGEGSKNREVDKGGIE